MKVNIAVMAALLALVGTAMGQDSTLVAHYLFNGNARDTSGYGNHGTAIDATLTDDRFGNAQNAYFFPGVFGNRISIPDAPSLRLKTAFTISAWVRPDTFPEIYDSAPYVGKGPATSNNFDLTIEGQPESVHLSFVYSLSGSTYLIRYDNWLTPEKVRKWTHIVAVYDGNTNNFKFYEKGENILESTSAPACLDTSLEYLEIGSRRGYEGTYRYRFYGALDDIRIYNRALSESEVTAIYNAEKPADSALVAHYLFNGNARDTSGYGNHGTEHNGVALTTDRFGQENNAYKFDGVDDYIEAADSPSLDMTGSMTMCLWVKPDTCPQTQDGATLISKGQHLNDNYDLNFSGAPAVDLRFLGFVDGSPYQVNTPGWLTPEKVGKWHHLAVIYDSASGNVRFFENGSLLDELTGFPSHLSPCDDALQIGGNHDALGTYFFYFKGAIDDIRIYSYSLSPSEIFAIYDAEKPTSSLSSGLSALYHFTGDTQDSLGSTHAVNFGATPIHDRFGYPERAYSFNGTDEYMLVNYGWFTPNIPALSFTLWQKPASGQEGCPIWINPLYASVGIKDSSGQAIFQVKLADGNWYAAGFACDTTEYHQLAATYRRGDRIEIWEDGQLKAQTPLPSLDLEAGPNQVSCLAASRMADTLFFGGELDDIRVYHRALSGLEISELYEIESTGQLQPPPQVFPPASAHLSVDTVHFIWNSIGMAGSYRFQAAQDTTFTASLLDVPTADTTWAYPAQLMSGWWYWRARAYAAGMADSSDWSVARAFIVDTEAPLPPVLKGPPDMAWVSGGPNLEWSASANASLYRAQVTSDTTFVVVTKDTVTADTFRLVPPLPNGKYFWRVAAGDSAGNWSGWSEVRRYRLDATDVRVLTTWPAAGQSNVQLLDTVKIRFSEPVVISSFDYTCVPDPGGWHLTVSPNRDTFRLAHAPFDTSTGYTFTVTAAADSAGNGLVPGPVNNPWTFSTTADGVGPVLRHTPVTAADSGTAVPLTAYATDPGSGVQTVILYYRQGGRDEFTEVAMSHPSDSTYQAQIPASEVTVRGLSYYLRAVDNLGSHSFSPAGAPAVRHQPRVALGNVVYGPTLSAGSYRMFALPFETAGPPWRPSQLADDLGAYDAAVWRLFRWQSGAYAEYEAVQDIVPGRAYWIINRNGGTFDLADGRTVADSSFHIPLSSGWNMAGTPFNYSVSLSDIRVYLGGQNFAINDTANTLTERRMVDYNGTGYVNSTLIEAWHGYWVRALTGGVTLMVPAASATDKSEPLQNPEGWMLSLEAECGGYHDRDNRVGITPRGPRDNASEPPAVGQGVSLGIDNGGQRLAEDYRSEIGQGQCWRFTVDCGHEGQVELSWREEGERGWQYAVYDAGAGRAIEGGSHRYQAGKGARQFAVLAGSPEYIASEAVRAGLVPSATLLEKCWPNPFQQITNVRYQLTKGDLVRLAVYNVLGQKVRTLVDEVQPPGRYQITWDGRDGRGRRLGAGVYFLRFTAGEAGSTARMTLVR